MIQIITSRVGKYSTIKSVAGYSSLQTKVNLLTEGAVTDSDQILWRGRSDSDLLLTSRGDKFGLKSCNNFQTKLRARIGGIDMAALTGSVPYNALALFQAIGSGYTWAVPDLEFGYSDYERKVKFFDSNAIWMHPSTVDGDFMSPLWTKEYSCYQLSGRWRRHYGCSKLSYHRGPLGHTIAAFWNIGTTDQMSSYYLSGFYATVANGTIRYFNGSSWQTAYKQHSKSGTSTYGIDLTRSLPDDPIGFLSLALSASSSLPVVLGQNQVPSINYGPIDQYVVEANRLSKAAEDAFKTYLPAISEDQWADLADTCIDNMHAVNVNSPVLIKETVELGMSILRMAKGEFSSLPKSLESAWLSARYGVRLTASDLKSVVSKLSSTLTDTYEPVDHQKVHAQSPLSSLEFPTAFGSVNRKMWYEVWYRPRDYALLNGIRKLMDWDLWPSLQNAWDMVPFSFVVDWFLKVEDVCNYFDRRIYEQYIDVLKVMYTTKEVYKPVIATFLNLEEFCVTHYRRRLRSQLHYAPLRLERGHLSTINVVDGAALLIQCAK